MAWITLTACVSNLKHMLACECPTLNKSLRCRPPVLGDPWDRSLRPRIAVSVSAFPPLWGFLVNVLLWVFQSLLAAAFLAVGGMKIVRDRAELAAAFGWVEQFSDASVKIIGLLDALVGLGLILPGAFDIAPSLAPWAAVGGLALAGGGIVVHLRRSETSLAAGNLLYIALLAVVAWGRFGPHQF